jgi:hypothetical protein
VIQNGSAKMPCAIALPVNGNPKSLFPIRHGSNGIVGLPKPRFGAGQLTNPEKTGANMHTRYQRNSAILESARQFAGRRLRGEPIDSIEYTEIVSTIGDAFARLLEEEGLKVKLEKQKAAVAEVVPAANKARAKRDAAVKEAQARVADLERRLVEAKQTLLEAGDLYADVIDRPRQLQCQVDDTFANIQRLGNWLYRAARDSDWTEGLPAVDDALAAATA